MSAPRLALIGGVVSAFLAASAPAEEIILNDYGLPAFPAFSVDQPRLSAVLTDAGEVIRDGQGRAVVFNAFIDTGASGLVASKLQIVGYPAQLFTPEVLPLGLTAADYIGKYGELGVGGIEMGDVTRRFGVRVLNGAPGGSLFGGGVTHENYAEHADEFVDYGKHNLWARREIADTELVEQDIGGFLVIFADPVNVVGMPVIRQRVMVMDPTPLGSDIFDWILLSGGGAPANEEEIVAPLVHTYLLPSGDPDIPSAEDAIVLDVRMNAFVSPPPPPGETLPSYADNPMVRHVSASYTPAGGPTVAVADEEWLFDTGAGNTILGFPAAEDMGIVEPGEDFAAFVTRHKAAGGQVFPVGGIGDAIEAPLIVLDEIRIGTKGGADEVVWRNVGVLVLPIGEGDDALRGVFGMNLVMPSVDIDFDLQTATLDEIIDMFATQSPVYFERVVFDEDNEEVRLHLVPEPLAIVLLCTGAALTRRRRRKPARRASEG